MDSAPPVSPDLEVLFLSSWFSLSMGGRSGSQYFGVSGFFFGASAGCLAGRRREGLGEGDVAPGPRCPVLCGPCSHDPRSVNGLSKDNFCFSFAVGSCPAASNEKCTFSRDSGAGDLCGNRPHPRGLGCSDRPTVEGGGRPGREPGAPAFAAPTLRAPFCTPTSRTFYSGFPGSRALYRGKVNTIIPGPLTRRFWSCK